MQYLRFFEQYQQTLTFWSADGRYLAYPTITGDEEVEAKIVVVDTDSGAVVDEVCGLSCCMSPI